jgi:hypothetical protein
MLPKDLLSNIFAYLGTARELGTCAQVSILFRDAAKEETVWKELADRKYGAHVSQGTVHLYAGSWKSMIKDDNRLGAIPTLRGLWKCEYKFNRNDYFFCVLVTCIKWQRSNGEVLLYVDARGESDLREPWTSTIWKGDNPSSRMVSRPFSRGRLPSQEHASCGFTSVLSEERPGHYQGVLGFDESFFNGGNHYMFCYANSHFGLSDYRHVHLFKIEEGQSLDQVFASHPGFTYTREDEAPFANETLQENRERWLPHIPQAILDRPWNLPRWWV